MAEPVLDENRLRHYEMQTRCFHTLTLTAAEARELIAEIRQLRELVQRQERVAKETVR